MVSKVIDYFDRPGSIFFSLFSEDATKLKGLLAQEEHKKEINHPANSQGNHTPLFFACYGDSPVEIVDLLLENGADPLLRDTLGRTPLHLAANTANPAILKSLLASPGVANLVDHPTESTGQTPFHTLCLKGSGAGPTKKANNANVVECFQILLNSSQFKNNPLEAISQKDKNGLTPLMLAKHDGHIELLNAFAALVGQDLVEAVQVPAHIETLLKADFHGRTPLLEAAFVNNKDIVEAELTKGKNPNQVNIQTGRNALHLACCGLSDGAMVSLLLPKMIDPAASDYKGRTALHFAANTGRKDTVAVLIENRVFANINTLDADNRTALHALAMAGSRAATRVEVIDLLFAHGIDFKARDINGDTALDIAEQRGNTVVIDRIKTCIAAATAVQTEQPVEEAGPSFLPGFMASIQPGETATDPKPATHSPAMP